MMFKHPRSSLILTVVILMIDQFTKGLATYYLIPYQPKTILPLVNFTLAYNNGAAFSLLANTGNIAKILFTVSGIIISLVILLWIWRLKTKQWQLAISLALILGGALGNLYDRISHGYVIDFIDLYLSDWHWPAFNIADATICIGAGILLFFATRAPH